MASIKRRPDGKWRARYRAPDGRERARHFARKIDAEKWISTETANVARGVWIDPQLGRITFAQWVERWRDGLHDLRPTTKALNLGIVDSVLKPRFGSIPLARITTADVRQMATQHLEAGELSSSAIRRRVIILRSVLQAACDDGLIGRNPCQGVKLPPETRRDMRFLEPDQVRQLADKIRPHHYRPLVYTAAYVGLRYGELAALGVEHVDPLRRTIKVERTLVDVNGRQSFGPPKTRSGVRTVTVPAAVAEMLGEHMGAKPVKSSGLVFPTVTGLPMRRPNFRTVWRKAVDGTDKRPGVFRGTDLANLVFHELRHTAAALAIAQGAHPMVIKERLGHSSITTTLDVYGGLFPSQDEALAEALDEVFREAAADSGADQMRTDSDSVASLRRSER